MLLFQYAALLSFILNMARNTAIAGRVKTFFSKLLDGGKDEAFPISTVWLSGIFLTLLLSILIPAAVISASPHEFMDVTTYKNPLGVILYSTCYAVVFFPLVVGNNLFYAECQSKEYSLSYTMDSRRDFFWQTISTEEKVLSPCMVTSSELIGIKEHKGNGFTENGRWYSVHDNIFKKENWTLVDIEYFCNYEYNTILGDLE